jgi:anhydro-N-acetylmuramic acid kinase
VGTRRVVGCMTGTSLDGIDLALVEVTGTGLGMSARFARGLSAPLGPAADSLRALAAQEPMTAGQVARLSLQFAAAHAQALTDLLGGERSDLVCIHGQTVFHAPPASWQLLNPFPIARAASAPVVYDLRQADLAAGGQGAPITPIADFVLFRHAQESRAVVNLGGFCNVTLLPAVAGPPGPAELAAVRARDVCACNHVLDHVARTLLRKPFDEAGQAAASGTPHPQALEDLDGVLRSQSLSRRSLGTGDEAAEWASRWRAHLSPRDVAATACEAIAQAIADATRECEAILLAGGSVRHAALVRAIGSAASARVSTSDAAGVPASYREAACFAVLGALCQDRTPITLPQVTGCSPPAPIAGAWVLP